MKKQLLVACGVSALAIGGLSPAFAQDSEETEIVITGSLIAGTPEDAALPVDVIGAEELAKQGNPSTLDLVKALPSSSASLGDANQFDSRSQGAEGIATVNLRGLSPQRTLVLLNSKRLATSGNGVPAVDINLLPQAAIGRVEVLKDGAAATYGSEAIAGVVNFITRTNQRGFNVAGSWRFIDGSDGDVDASISYGHVGDNFRVLFAAGFQKRGQLMAKERDWAIRPYEENPQGGWTGGGNPANFLFLGATGSPVSGIVADTACAPLGGYVGADARCYNQYSVYDNLVELEKRGQAFVDFEWDVAPSTTFQVTALYGRTTVPHYLTSPSYLLTQPPSSVAIAGTPWAPFGALLNAGFFVPSANPGLAAYRAANPTPAGAGVLFPTLLFRPYLLGGNPSTLGDESEPGSARGMRKSESTRLTAELRGEVADGLNYNLNLTYHNYYRYIDGYDSYGDRVQRALLGCGGPNCTGSTPGAKWLSVVQPIRQCGVGERGYGRYQPGGERPEEHRRADRLVFRPIEYQGRHEPVRCGRVAERRHRHFAARWGGAIRCRRAISRSVHLRPLWCEQQSGAESLPRIAAERQHRSDGLCGRSRTRRCAGLPRHQSRL